MIQTDRERMRDVDVLIRSNVPDMMGRDLVYAVDGADCDVHREIEYLDHFTMRGGERVHETIPVREIITVTLTTGKIREATEDETRDFHKIKKADCQKGVRLIRFGGNGNAKV